MTLQTNETLARSSTGQNFTDGNHLDRHFLACQPEYESILKSAGLQPGWHVLDAGCGSGSFLPLMSQLLDRSGRIEALDLAPENVTLIDEQQAAGKYSCPVNAQVGNVTQLPYEDNRFDAIWCAATTMYLNDDELDIALSEFRRVLKDGGILALKDIVDPTWQWQPTDPLLWPRLTQAEVAENHGNRAQTTRNIQLPARIRQAGFNLKKAKTFMVERRQPLREVERSYIAGIMRGVATGAANIKQLSPTDQIAWEKIADTSAADHILNHPDFYHCEGHIIIVAENQLKEH